MNFKEEIAGIKAILDRVNDPRLIDELKKLLSSFEARSTFTTAEEECSDYSSQPDKEADQQIIESIMNLSEYSRAELAQKLLDSLDNTEMESEWISLAEKRLAEIESGQVRPISWNEIKTEVTNAS